MRRGLETRLSQEARVRGAIRGAEYDTEGCARGGGSKRDAQRGKACRRCSRAALCPRHRGCTLLHSVRATGDAPCCTLSAPQGMQKEGALSSPPFSQY